MEILRVRPMKPRFVLYLAALLLTVSIGAQNKQKEEPLLFVPQWTAQAQFAGYYVAKEKGFYDEEGIEVTIGHPNATQSSEDRIRHNMSHATTLQLAQAIQMINDGIPMVNLLQTSMNNSLVFISRRGKDPLEQKGAKVAIWKAGFNQLAECLVREERLDYELIQAANCVNLFIAGAVDATLAMGYNEYFQILQSGIPITEDCVYRFKDHGYNVQEDGLYMTRTYYEKHKEQAEKFARASKRGWEYTVEHPDEALDIVMDYVRRNHIATNRIIQERMLQEILRMMEDPDTGKREYLLRADMVEQANELMLRSNLISKPVTLEELSR